MYIVFFRNLCYLCDFNMIILKSLTRLMLGLQLGLWYKKYIKYANK
jgi:hypothetical protein